MKLYALTSILNVAEPGQEFEIGEQAGKTLLAAGEAETAEQATARIETERAAKAAELQQLAEEAMAAAEQAAKDAEAVKAAKAPTSKK